MKKYKEMTAKERSAEMERLMALYKREQAQGYQLDMTRGKPDAMQLNLSMDMLA